MMLAIVMYFDRPRTRRSASRLGIVVASLFCVLTAQAQYELITIEHPFRAQNLAGIVVDSTGAPVPGASIEDRDATFTNVLASTTTDANGSFELPRTKVGTTHYLHVQSKGFDPMHITVTLRHLAKLKLKIQLHIAS
jgi:hypothetical protein